MKQAVFYAKNWLVRPQVRHTLRTLADLDRLSDEELVELNASRRALILKHAFDTTRFYRESYTRAGITRADLDRPDILEHLPTVTRQDIREAFDSMISSEVRPDQIGRSSTGGSTGAPLTIGTDPRHALEVISWRRLRYWGAEPSDNAGYIYRAIPQGASAKLRAVYHFPTRRSYLGATSMTEAAMAAFISDVQASDAKYWVSYVGALKILAEYVSQKDISFPALKFIWSTAAPLPLSLRLYLEKVFRVPVFSQYGSCEFYWIASERKDRTGHDIDWDIRHVEILDDANRPVPRGEHGKLVITDMINRAFPLIRYEIEDRSRFLPIAGSEAAFPVLDYVSGRTADIIPLKNGTKIPGEFWTTVFYDYAEKIRSFTVQQTKDYAITVSFVPGAGWTPALEKELAARLETITRGTPVIVQAKAVDLHDRGKLSFVSSEVGKN